MIDLISLRAYTLIKSVIHMNTKFVTTVYNSCHDLLEKSASFNDFIVATVATIHDYKWDCE